MRVVMTLLMVMACCAIEAETWSVGAGTKYRFQSQCWEGYVCLGAYQDVQYPVYYQSGTTEPTDDGWWYIELNQSASTDSATYIIRNAVTDQILYWSGDYQNDRYLNVTDEVTDYSRWRIVRIEGDWLGIINVAQSDHSWNLRTGTHQLGTYGSYPSSYNSVFYIIDEDGNFLQEGDPADLVTMTDITLNHTGLRMPVGSSIKLDWTYAPSDATDTRIQWTSGSTGIANVDANGNITAMSTGTTVITAAARKGGASAQCKVEVYTPGSGGGPAGGDTLFVFLANGRMEAFPMNDVKSNTRNGAGDLIVVTTDGTTWKYDRRDIDSTTTEFRGRLPEMLSFKFNNKFNDQLMEDITPKTLTRTVNGVEETYMPSTFRVWITSCIGKRLTASFKLSDDDAAVYLDGEEQISKVTRRRFENGPLDYVVAPRYYKVYTSTGRIIYDISDPNNPQPIGGESGAYEMRPYGRHYTANIAWAVDDSDGQYKVPEVYITTEDGQLITTKAYYKAGTIRIEGNSVFPDMAQTDIQIKGRGNSSWGGGYSKEPYHFKFETKQKVLGMTKGKHWVLLANKQSGSMTTNALAQRMADMVASPACNHIVPVELYINGEYRGSYNMTEKIGFSNNSIDLDDESGAFLLQLDSYYDEVYKWRDPSYGLPNMVMEPDLEEIALTDEVAANSQFAAIQEHWNNFTEKLKYGTYADAVDVDGLARSMFVTDLSLNRELMHPKSWFVYNETALADNGDGTWSLNEESPYVFGPVWDFDWGFGYEGHGTYFIDEAQRDIFNNGGTGNPFFRQLLRGSDEVQKAYYRVWTEFLNSGRLEELIEYCDDYYDFAQLSFEHNATKWSDGRNYQTQTTNAKSWLQTRANYIYSNLQEYDLDDDPVITLGDVNKDGAITAADLVCVLNYIHGLPNEDFSFKQADTDANDLITMRDAAAIINLIMGQAANAPRQLRLPQAAATLRMTPFQAYQDQTALMPLSLTVGEGEYSGLQFDLRVPEGMEVGNLRLPESLNGYTAQTQWIDENTYRVIVYASAHDLMPEGRVEMLLELTPEQAIGMAERLLTVNAPMLVTADGQDHRMVGSSVHFDMPETDGIQMAKSDLQSNQGDGRIYDLSGRRVERPQHGIYIINGKKMVR